MDNMDELIREASKSHHPVYDDKAWEKMQVLLNKHLPQNKDKRRKAIFFLSLLFMGAIGLFAILYPRNKKRVIPANAIENKPANTPLQTTTQSAKTINAAFLKNSSKKNKDIATMFLQAGRKVNTRKKEKKALSNTRLIITKSYIKTNGADAVSDLANDKSKVLENDNALQERSKQDDNEDGIKAFVFSTDSIKDQLINIDAQTAKNDVVAVTKLTTKAASKTDSQKAPLKEKGKRGFTNNFAITLSAGPDQSFVALGDAGKVRFNYGAGLSYTLAQRFTLRSGFYRVKKVYSAKAADYHPPSGYWTNNINLERVDADCKVYEIPFIASYKIKQSKNHDWFAGIGLSTYLMKSETYHYLYKNQLGQIMYRGWTLRNKNKHYFSVLNISGGYQYRVNKYFSIIAEPYLKLPLHGIGFGKINLNSGGLLFTASIQPFAKGN